MSIDLDSRRDKVRARLDLMIEKGGHGRPERRAVAAARQQIALDMRAAGKTWRQIGEHLGVSTSRAKQIANPRVKRRPGNPQSGKPEVAPGTTIAQLIESRARAVDECAAAHGAVQP